MSNQVYANGMEVSCKAAAGSAICAFPDVCFTPPQTPATPPGVPVPYPNTGKAEDTSDGSSSVKISGQEIMLKNKSYFKKSMGDEAGCAPKKNVLTSKISGKVYFNAWSMTVFCEGENVVRHLDITTHNHGSYPAGTGPWPYVDAADLARGGICHGVDQKYAMTPYSQGCDNGQTPHHVIPDRQLNRGDMKILENYTHGSAPCLCVDGRNQHTDEHGQYHAVVDAAEYSAFTKESNYKYSDSRAASLESVQSVNKLDPKEKKSKKILACAKKQLDNYYKKRCRANDSSILRSSGKRGKNLRKLKPPSVKSRGGRM